MMEEVYVIDIEHFTKDYGSGRGVFDISFKIKKGDFFGFLGPNGAGKSTTIRHLMGFSKPDEGKLCILGKDVLKNKVELMFEIGYLPGEVNLPLYLTGNEFIKEQKSLKCIKNDDYLKELIKIFPLDLNQEIKFMSLGDKRKLAILSAFMSDPQILILDEPTSGLDPLSQDVFKKYLLKEKSREKTILLSSHIFKEIDDTCDRIAIIKDGKIVSNFDKKDFNLKNKNCYLISFKDTNSAKTFKSRIGKNIKILNENENDISVKVEDGSTNDLFFCLSDLNITYVKELKESLEDYFLSFYKEDKEYKGI